MLNWLARTAGRIAGAFMQGRASVSKISARSRGRRRIRASYDAAQTTDENKRHWENADSLSANAAMDSSTRQTLRDRSRYEYDNNSYYKGLIDGMATDLVGTGPRLQLSIPKTPDDVIRAIEVSIANWSRAADFPEDLRVMEMTELRDGEDLGILVSNPALRDSGLTPITLDMSLYEAEQCADPWYWKLGLDPLYADGIRRDSSGNPVEYTFLKGHPGGVASWAALDTVKYPASQVIHWYRACRPGQARGIPVLTPGLPLGAQLRRYTLATLGAAEFAATIYGVLKTKLPPPSASEQTKEPAAFDTFELSRGVLPTMPDGWEIDSIDPRQPTTTYKDFKHEILNEMGKAAQAPFNVVTGNSSGYNYSSGRLDHLLYQKTIRVKRQRMRAKVLDRVLIAWEKEARLIGLIPPNVPPISQWQWEWHWDGFESIDPEKDAKTDEIELRIGTTTLADVYARKGKDWREAISQRERELAMLGDAGMTAAQAMTTPSAPSPEDEASGKAAAGAGGVQSTALNGAQITSLLLVTDKVVLKQYPPDAAEAVIQAAFPLMSKALIAKFVAGLKDFVPQMPPIPAATASAHGSTPKLNGHADTLPSPIQSRLDMPDLAAFGRAFSQDVSRFTAAMQTPPKPPPVQVQVDVSQTEIKATTEKIASVESKLDALAAKPDPVIPPAPPPVDLGPMEHRIDGINGSLRAIAGQVEKLKKRKLLSAKRGEDGTWRFTWAKE